MIVNNLDFLFMKIFKTCKVTHASDKASTIEKITIAAVRLDFHFAGTCVLYSAAFFGIKLAKIIAVTITTLMN